MRGHCRVSADRGRPPLRLTRLSCDCGSVRTTKGQRLMLGPVTAEYSLRRLLGMCANVRSNRAGQRSPQRAASAVVRSSTSWAGPMLTGWLGGHLFAHRSTGEHCVPPLQEWCPEHCCWQRSAPLTGIIAAAAVDEAHSGAIEISSPPNPKTRTDRSPLSFRKRFSGRAC